MATTFADDMPARRWRSIHATGAAAVSGVGAKAFPLIVAVMCMFAFRDMLTGSLRYFLSLAHLGVVWFIPDLLSFLIFVYFAWVIGWQQRSPFAILLVLSFFVSTVLGLVFMQTNGFAAFSAVKLFLPFFVGAALAGRSVMELRWARWTLTAIFVASIIGLLISPHVEFPWIGQALDNFGQVKRVGKVWWSGEKIRYGGFAGESTMAAYMCIVPYILVHRQFSRLVNIALWIPIYSALQISTSKTALITFIAFVAYYLYFEFMKGNRLTAARKIAALSFATVFIPFILMIFLGGFDLTSIDPTLFSMQDRISRTWVFPFTWLSENFPVGLIAGCGMGCFTYPMGYTSMAELLVPVDNFYVATYIMMGAPFIVLVIGMVMGVRKNTHHDKLALIAMLNLYAITVQCYGPSTSTIMLAYAFSDMFLPGAVGWRRTRKTRENEHPAPATA
jgi:hypothetical protein